MPLRHKIPHATLCCWEQNTVHHVMLLGTKYRASHCAAENKICRTASWLALLMWKKGQKYEESSLALFGMALALLCFGACPIPASLVRRSFTKRRSFHTQSGSGRRRGRGRAQGESAWRCPPLSMASSGRQSHCQIEPPVAAFFDIGGTSVEVAGGPGVSEIDLRRAISSTPFQEWAANLKGPGGILTLKENGGFSLERVVIQNVDMFGQRVGFVKFKADIIHNATGKKIPGIVFGRGGAVGILMLLECNGEIYTVLTEQARVPIGRVILELPAGMLDGDSKDFVGTAAREVEEETGIHIKSADLIDLTGLLQTTTGQKMFPSAGGCDEEITLLLYRGHAKEEVIRSLQGQETGLQDHGEFIKVHVVPYNTLWRTTSDAKALAAIALYEMAKKEGILPPPPNGILLSPLNAPQSVNF